MSRGLGSYGTADTAVAHVTKWGGAVLKIFDFVAVGAVFFTVMIVAVLTGFAVLGHDDKAFSYALFFGVPTATVTSFVVGREIRAVNRRRLRQERICANCGYDLRGQIEPRCPECGEAY